MANAGTVTETGACALSRPLRSQLTAHLLLPLATTADTETRELRRRAALYALDNFGRLQDEETHCITDDRLYELVRFGKAGAQSGLLSLLYRELTSIGHVIGEKKSTTHVATNGSAMPITFNSPRYGIDALDLFKLICSTRAAA